jgi:hypothetical protein
MTDTTPTMDEIRAFTPQQAGEALAAMTAASNPAPSPVPADSQDAKAQLDLLTRDPTFAQALMSGNGAARAQFDKLSQMIADADVVGDRIAGIQEQPALFETTMFGELPSSAVRGFIADRQASGIPDDVIAETLEWKPVPVRDHAATLALQAARFSDPEWKARVLRGDWNATGELKRMSDILSRPVAEK